MKKITAFALIFAILFNAIPLRARAEMENRRALDQAILVLNGLKDVKSLVSFLSVTVPAFGANDAKELARILSLAGGSPQSQLPKIRLVGNELHIDGFKRNIEMSGPVAGVLQYRGSAWQYNEKKAFTSNFRDLIAAWEVPLRKEKAGYVSGLISIFEPASAFAANYETGEEEKTAAVSAVYYSSYDSPQRGAMDKLISYLAWALLGSVLLALALTAVKAIISLIAAVIAAPVAAAIVTAIVIGAIYFATRPTYAQGLAKDLPNAVDCSSAGSLAVANKLGMAKSEAISLRENFKNLCADGPALKQANEGLRKIRNKMSSGEINLTIDDSVDLKAAPTDKAPPSTDTLVAPAA